MTTKQAPSIALSWSATSLTTDFLKYRLYRRPSRLPIAAWELLTEIDVPTGYTPATVEAQHTQYIDWDPGWGTVGAWAAGWDYAVAVVQTSTGVESAKSTIVARNVVTADVDPWVVNSTAPYLNFSLPLATQFDATDENVVISAPAAGRDELIARTRLELPARKYQIAWDNFLPAGEDQVRTWRAAAASGRAMSYLTPLGDRVIGLLGALGVKNELAALTFPAAATLTETQRSSPVANYNLPAGLVLNGSSQYVTTADNALLNPTTIPFTVFVAGAFPNAGVGLVSKGDIAGATTSNYGITRPSSNTIRFAFKGVTTAGTVDEANAVWVDGNPHVAIGTSTGTAQVLYRDGTQVNTGAVTHGSITTTKALVAGADNAGASGFMGLNPLRAWGFYPRALTALEAQNLSYYLLGYPGYRMPTGASVFYDLADDRTWNGITSALVDQTGNGLAGTAVATPVTRGKPWPLRQLDRFG